MLLRNDRTLVYDDGDDALYILKNIPLMLRVMYAIICLTICLMVFIIVSIVKYATIAAGCVLKFPKSKSDFDAVVEGCTIEFNNAFDNMLNCISIKYKL